MMKYLHKNKGFTLIEVLVSIVLLGLITLFVASTIYQTKINNKLFQDKIKKNSRNEIFLNVLYNDISQSSNLSINNYKRYSIISFSSNNSVYGISHPYVTWLVLKKENSIARFESARKITLPIKSDMQKYTYMDIVQKNCEYFQVNLSKNKKQILVFIKNKKQKPYIFEVNKL